eukprot:884613-Pyramimonas_sp.AAC.1
MAWTPQPRATLNPKLRGCRKGKWRTTLRQGISEPGVARVFLTKVAGAPRLREPRGPELRE